METILGLGMIGIFMAALIWWLPIILILSSDKTGGTEKLIWILLIFFFSWFSWLIYLFIAPVAQANKR